MGAYSTAVLALSPGQFLELQEASGTNANDSTANNRDGTYTGAGIDYQQASLLAAEPAAFSVNLAGPLEHIATTYAGITGSLTVIGWARRTNTAAHHPMFGSDVGQDVILRCLSGGTNVEWYSDSNDSGVTWTAAFPTATNIFWALTYVDATKTSELFINGVSQGTKVSAVALAAARTILYGEWGGTDYWVGRMSHVALFPSVLTAPQILNLYTVGTRASIIYTRRPAVRNL